MPKKILLLLTSLIAFNLVFASLAIARDDDEDSEYNFSWLDPDKKIYVLQNRKYRKAKKIALFIAGGMDLSNAYKTESMIMPRASYWFTESMGIEVFYNKSFSKDSDNLDALKKVSASALPFVRETKGYYGAVFSWVPWYAKMNFFNKIVYLDWGLNAGLGKISTRYDQNNKASLAPNFLDEDFTAYFVGTSQNYFLTRHFSLRLDLIGIFYNAKAADGVTTKTYNNFDFTAGVGYTF